MHTDLPKTINDAIKILAYNEYFWYNAGTSAKSLINAHPKDRETVTSLAEAEYAWTEKQAKLALLILKRYLTKFQKHAMDISALLDNPIYDAPFREISWEKTIKKFVHDDEAMIEIRFPYIKKLITLMRCVRQKRGLPVGYSSYDGDSKKWTFKQSDVSTYFLVLIAIRYDFKFLDMTLLDDFDEVKKQIKGYRKPTAKLVDDKIVLSNASESLREYWQANVASKKLLAQVDHLKEFGIGTNGIRAKSWSTLGGKIAHCEHRKAWIDRREFSRDQVCAALVELDCFPLLMPISGDPNSYEDAEDWRKWLQVFARHKIEYKNMSFGFDMRAPTEQPKLTNDYKNEWDIETQELDLSRLETLHELNQLSKQFKYVDNNTKIIFVRNRIPNTLIKSKVKPKCCFVALGGGYYASGTENLKRYLDNLPKTLYYNDHQPSSYDWNDKIINKL